MSQRLEMLERMIAKGSQDPFVHYAHAMELRTLGRTQEALSAFRGVVTRFPAYVPTYLMAAQTALALSDNETARTLLEQGLVRAKDAGDEHAHSELDTALAGLPA